MRRVLVEAQWRPLARAHEDVVRGWTQPRLERRRRGERHPVDDFLWDYYRLSPAQLALWHPGDDVILTGDPPVSDTRHYRHQDGGWAAVLTTADPLWGRLERHLTIMRATSARPMMSGCFGMHEWAMVDGLTPGQVRHPDVPLRLPPQQVSDLVSEVGLRCTHFDAFRFFTPSARLQQRPLTRVGQVDDEQPGCLHAGMDLYRYAYEAAPFVGSELVVACFRHARAARDLDMAASPYDLTAWGVAPVAVESAAGRREYARRQRDLALRAATLRDRLIHRLGRSVASAARGAPDPAQSDPPRAPARGR